MKAERTDNLRRRPHSVRYFYLAVSNNKLHTGISYGGLDYAYKNHGINQLYIADVVTQKVIHVQEKVEDFMTRWRAHYNDPSWSYEADVEYDIPVPKI